MSALQLVYGLQPIFKTKCTPVASVDDELRDLALDMLEALKVEHAVGLGANMFGIAKPVAVVDIMENGTSNPYVFINPEIIWASEEIQTFEEASLSFPGISIDITRPRAIKLKYLDIDGKLQELEANDFFAQVIQHEVDYLNGKTIFDHLSKMKRDILIKKMQKFMKNYTPHVHDENCGHAHHHDNHHVHDENCNH